VRPRCDLTGELDWKLTQERADELTERKRWLDAVIKMAVCLSVAELVAEYGLHVGEKT
jgi:hypothetical protein